jgi:hypothetical protein
MRIAAAAVLLLMLARVSHSEQLCEAVSFEGSATFTDLFPVETNKACLRRTQPCFLWKQPVRVGILSSIFRSFEKREAVFECDVCQDHGVLSQSEALFFPLALKWISKKGVSRSVHIATVENSNGPGRSFSLEVEDHDPSEDWSEFKRESRWHERAGVRLYNMNIRGKKTNRSSFEVSARTTTCGYAVTPRVTY